MAYSYYLQNRKGLQRMYSMYPSLIICKKNRFFQLCVDCFFEIGFGKHNRCKKQSKATNLQKKNMVFTRTRNLQRANQLVYLVREVDLFLLLQASRKNLHQIRLLQSICLFGNCLNLCISYIYQKKSTEKRYCVHTLPGLNFTNLSYILLHLITY